VIEDEGREEGSEPTEDVPPLSAPGEHGDEGGEQPASEEAGAEAPPAEAQGEDTAEAADADAAEQRGAEGDDAPAAEAPADEAPAADAPAADAPADDAPAAEAPAADAPAPEAPAKDADAPAERPKPEIPGADLEVDIVPEGADALAPLGEDGEPLLATEDGAAADTADEPTAEPIAQVAIDLAADARYRATGKRKTAVARVILKPGSGEYEVNGRSLNEFFPRATLQRNIRQPLETVGYESRMDVVASLHGGGVSAQAGALRHGISRALIEADPNLRGELKRRGFLTRDARAKERKKAGLKKARKRPQFSKR
jgi:small subunit ribosomal protein S9